MSQPLERAESALGMNSTELLQGRKSVTILHNGMPYRLQATKLGKLILTK
ncbi:hemin uptake protein HemP [Comamonas endophytica]|uniref:Hemin uptake protein HemP n=1 Tax=Comamonas endophytica TaxID=2949090 RepID=A0ABY6GDV1_9BURK|nr:MULTISPECIES: hemin uptake protein HemP [unclassified Acidovorax]MCD2512193.1 hemin uptake protein HemP [Acidovorax sp. D4N7]UYG53225.1 hemin uptake protein HemP [Acidovorax sp. 5MLIR]